MKIRHSLGAIALLAGLVAPAAATTFDFNLTGTDPIPGIGNSGWPYFTPTPVSHVNGNTKSFTSGTVSLTASAFHANKTGSSWSVSTAHLYSFPTDGLAITATGENSTAISGNGDYQIDNVGSGIDFVLFSFSEAVTLNKITTVSYGSNGVYDSDFAFAAVDATSLVTLGASLSGLAAVDVSGVSYASFINTSVTTDVASQYWVVAASPSTNNDITGHVGAGCPSGSFSIWGGCYNWTPKGFVQVPAVPGHDTYGTKADTFKLTGLTVSTLPPPPPETPSVPEPATWAMMMLGFGLVGAAMRRRPALRHVAA